MAGPRAIFSAGPWKLAFRAEMHSDVYNFVLSFSEADLNEFLINFEGLNSW
jgi:hypothetical protein